jgi:hypothetical protein
MLPEARNQNLGVRRHDCALERRDMSRRGKAATCRRTPNVKPRSTSVTAVGLWRNLRLPLPAKRGEISPKNSRIEPLKHQASQAVDNQGCDFEVHGEGWGGGPIHFRLKVRSQNLE